MVDMKNLAEISVEEQRNFFNSFDVVLSDLDGVIWLAYHPIPGAVACVKSLKQLGKKFYYVTNNSTVPLEVLLSKLNDNGFQTQLNEIASPVFAIISYLKEINFNKQVFAISTKYFRTTLEQAGILLADEAPKQIEDCLETLHIHLNDDENIGAVIVDIDINVNFVKLQKAITYLRRNNCLFIVGAGDQRIPLKISGPVIGPHYYLNALKELTDREPYHIGKPNKNYNNFLTELFNIKHLSPERVLYIGDTVNEDLKFATSCGYQKLLVLTGNTKKKDVEDWKHLEEYKPHFYVESLNVVDKILKNIF